MTLASGLAGKAGGSSGGSSSELANSDSELAGLVDLKFFCGFSFAEIAVMRNVSERTVQRQWEKARIYLHHTIQVEALS